MRNRPLALVPLILVVATILTAAPSVAQPDPFAGVPPGPRRVDVSASGGFFFATDWSDLVLLGSVSPASGALEQVLARDLSVDPATVFDAVVTYWEGRYGFRVHGGFAQSCLTFGGGCREAAGISPGPGAIGVDAWTYDIGGAIGLIEYARTAWAWPYVFFGAGGVTYNLERSVGPPLTFVERAPVRTADGQLVVSRDDPEQLIITIDELSLETRVAFHFGAGADFRVPVGPGSVGLRLEVSDHVHRSPVEIQVTNVERVSRPDTRIDFGVVHNLRAAAGLVLQFGR